MSAQNAQGNNADSRVLIGLYDQEKTAETAIRKLIEEDFPMDRLSILGKAQSSGDDPLGIYYPSVGERMKGWGAMGAIWGGLWGLLSGAGMFMIPGIGPVLAAGPVVEAIAGALAGAGLAGGAMAGAAALSEFSYALHRSGVPEDRLEELQQALDQGRYMVMLILTANEIDRWKAFLQDSGATTTEDYPYRGLDDIAS
jgi:hypothetical protein